MQNIISYVFMNWFFFLKNWLTLNLAVIDSRIPAIPDRTNRYIGILSILLREKLVFLRCEKLVDASYNANQLAVTRWRNAEYTFHSCLRKNDLIASSWVDRIIMMTRWWDDIDNWLRKYYACLEKHHFYTFYHLFAHEKSIFNQTPILSIRFTVGVSEKWY